MSVSCPGGSGQVAPPAPRPGFILLRASREAGPGLTRGGWRPQTPPGSAAGRERDGPSRLGRCPAQVSGAPAPCYRPPSPPLSSSPCPLSYPPRRPNQRRICPSPPLSISPTFVFSPTQSPTSLSLSGSSPRPPPARRRRRRPEQHTRRIKVALRRPHTVPPALLPKIMVLGPYKTAPLPLP